MLQKLIITFIFALSLFGCQKEDTEKAQLLPPEVKKTEDNVIIEEGDVKVSVMAYNLENLFDDVNDGIPNETVLQTKDLQKKLSQLAKAILQINGVGPDILMVEEVENLRVLNMLNEYMPEANYQTVKLIDGNDERGIDVGILSRFPIAGEIVLHRMPFEDVNPTRGILEVPLLVGGSKVVRAFALHFPSQANPVDQRRQAVELLRKLMSSVSANEYAVAGGDFNITKKEEDSQQFFKQDFKDYKVTHLVGCSECLGTHHFKKDWSFLDAIISREANMIFKSVKTPNAAPTQVHADGSPRRFDKRTGLGISDHLPIYAEIVIKM